MSGIDSTPSPLTKEFQEMLNAPIEVEFECNLKDSAAPSGMSMRKVVLSVIDGKMTLRVGDAVIDKAKFLGQYAALPIQAGTAMQNAYKLAMAANVKALNDKK